MKNPGLVSVIIPIFNEAENLPEFLRQIDAVDIGAPKELVFIDDASQDGSVDILQNFPFQSLVQKLSQSQNQGKGAALHRGIAAATGEIIVVQDADFEYDMNDLKKLISPVLKGEADIVYGSRFAKTRTQVHRTFHYLVNRFLTLVSNLCSGLYLTDMETCYKVFRADIIQNINLESQRFGFEPEVTAKIARLKVRVEELPIRYFPRTYLEGKKITWKDGLAALGHIVRYNLCTDQKEFFKKEMPTRFVIHSRQWL